MGHVTHVVSSIEHMNKFYYTYQWVIFHSLIPHINASCEYTHMNEFYYEYIMSIPQYSTALLNIWMSSIIHINESYEHMNEFYYTYQWVIWVEYDDSTHKCVMAHVSMSNLAHPARLHGNTCDDTCDEFCHHTCDEFCWTYVWTNDCVMAHIWMSHVMAHIWMSHVMSHIWMSHVMSHIWMSHVTHVVMVRVPIVTHGMTSVEHMRVRHVARSLLLYYRIICTRLIHHLSWLLT